jgi:hypothetical protein
MTQDEIIEMARQAQQESFVGDKGHCFKMEAKDLERFAKLVAAKEREACAKVCENLENEYSKRHDAAAEDRNSKPVLYMLGKEIGALNCAQAIRERGEA